MGRLSLSREETKFSGVNEIKEILILPVQVNTSRFGNLTRLIRTPMILHTYGTCTYSSTGTYVLFVVVFLPIYSGHQDRWTYQPGSHRRKVTKDFSAIFLLRRVPQSFWRGGFSHFFLASTVKSNFVY
jgi:hypothetical protein